MDTLGGTVACVMHTCADGWLEDSCDPWAGGRQWVLGQVGLKEGAGQSLLPSNK